MLAAAYCVEYQEEFLAGDVGDGAYVCHLVLRDSNGCTVVAGCPRGPGGVNFQFPKAYFEASIEAGILASNSTQPPAGWDKTGGDLNEGAGGDYIYFCIKRR